MKRKTGLGLSEIIVAVSVILVGLAPLLWMMTTTRVDTSKAINYLRGLELANEGIEWAQTVSFEKLENIAQSGNFGSLYQGSINVSQASKFKGSLTGPIKYPDQYDSAFFYRDIKCEDVDDERKGFLKKVTVTVGWNEAKVPENLFGSERMRMVELSCFVFNENNLEY